MDRRLYLLCISLGLLAAGCQKEKKEDTVVAQVFTHKYGYPVTKEEWATGKYPGRVTTLLRNGVTITAEYDGGQLHGISTHTYPHSQTIEASYVYNGGKLVKETIFDVKSIPLSETVQLSPTRYAQTTWYTDGSPLAIEEYVGEELLEGQYFNKLNEVESRVEKGNGTRIRRDREGVLVSRDELESGYMTKRENFFVTGAPESTAYYYKNKLNGEQKTFAANGEPLSISEWVNGQLHGKCTFFKNGEKSLEISYLHDQKNGLETHFSSGRVTQETLWENNKKHGATVYFMNDNDRHTDWYYDGKEVSEERFQELNRVDEKIAEIAPENQDVQ